jgi:hypothetical protein
MGSGRLEGNLSWSSTACHFLLFLEFLATRFDRNCKTDLGLLLKEYVSVASVYKPRASLTLK